MGAIVDPVAMRCVLSEVDNMKTAVEVEIACHPEGGICISCTDSLITYMILFNSNVDMTDFWITWDQFFRNSTARRSGVGNTTAHFCYAVESHCRWQ